MSVLTTAPIQVWPAAANSIAVITSSSQGELTDWNEIIPVSSISSAICIVGIVAEIHTGSSVGADNLEVQFGTGADGSETAISAPLLISAGQVNCAYETVMLPTAIANIAANARLSIRIRSNVTSETYHFALMYSAGLPVVGTTTGAYNYAPTGSGSGWPTSGALLTPNATPWANSAWVEALTLISVSTMLLGVAPKAAAALGGESVEIDIGVGEAGSETVITTLRNTFPWVGIQGWDNTWLPAGYPITVPVRVALRIRTSATSAAALRVHLLYTDEEPAPPAPTTAIFPTVRERTFTLPFETNLMLFLDRIEFLIQAGQGLVTGQGSDPVVAIWFSKDGGVNWGNGYTLNPGKIGETGKRTYLNRLGRGRNWACKIRVSDPVFWAFLDCYVDMTEGTS